jgi:predicted MFS family arabinose efflux permease
MQPETKKQRSSARARLWPLLGVNFFMADMQSGIGPFVGIFLQAHGWASGCIGTAMALGNVAGVAITTPIGGFIDASNHKRGWVIMPGIAVVLASALILLSQDFWAVAASQIASSLAGAAIVPAVTGITLGLVRQKGFNRQNGRNQAFNHAGNMVGAAASGYLGWKYGYTAVFQGAVITLQGVGRSLSPALGGRIAQLIGCGPAFLVLGGLGLISAAVWVVFATEMKKYQGPRSNRGAVKSAVRCAER